MNENIKNVISSKIKYHSNKQKYGYFIGNDCIDICASDILDDVIKAGYRKQEDTVKEFAEKLTKAINYEWDNYNSKDKPDAYWKGKRNGLFTAINIINEIAEQYGKEGEQ